MKETTHPADHYKNTGSGPTCLPDSPSAAPTPTAAGLAQRSKRKPRTPREVKTRQPRAVHPLVAANQLALKEAKGVAKVLTAIAELSEWQLDQVVDAIQQRRGILSSAADGPNPLGANPTSDLPNVR